MTPLELRKKLYVMKKNPELYASLPNDVLSEYLSHISRYVESMEGLSKELKAEYLDKVAELQQIASQYQNTERQVVNMVESKLRSIRQPKDGKNGKDGRNGKDAIVTNAQIQQAAEIALSLLELPDFDSLVDERITANPMAVRNSLETIVEEEEKLEQSAVKNLPEDLKQLQEQISRVYQTIQNGEGGVGTAKHVIDAIISQRIADGTIPGGGGGSVSVETPTGTVNGSNTSFTVANEPKWIVVDSVQYFAGVGYSYSSGTITTDIPPSQFIRSIY